MVLNSGVGLLSWKSAGDGGWTRLESAASTAGGLGAPPPVFVCIFSPSPSSISQKSELTFVNSLCGKLELEFGQKRDLQERSQSHLR